MRIPENIPAVLILYKIFQLLAIRRTRINDFERYGPNIVYILPIVHLICASIVRYELGGFADVLLLPGSALHDDPSSSGVSIGRNSIPESLATEPPH